MTFSHFLGKFKNGHIWLYQAWSTGVQKKWRQKFWKFFIFFFIIFFFKNREKYFGQKKSTFCPYEHPYDSPLSTLRKILKFLKWRFFTFFSKKKSKILFFFHFFNLNMVSIVEVEICGFLPFSNWPDFDQKWSKICHFGPQMGQNYGFSNFFA